MPSSVRAVLALVMSISPAVAACGDDDDDDAGGEVNVFAAASLTEAFESIGAQFEEANPGTSVTFNFASSSDLVTQITEGAPADVYASADVENMDELTAADLAAAGPSVFARNTLEIIVEPGNPLAISGVADLEEPDLIVVTCDPEVPIGAYSQEVFANAGVTVDPDSFEEDVKAVATKVILGEADAGVVYATDVRAAGGDADGVAIPDDVNVTAEYPIAVTAEAPNAPGGEAFVDFVLGEQGQAALAEIGFTAP